MINFANILLLIPLMFLPVIGDEFDFDLLNQSTCNILPSIAHSSFH